MCSDTPNTPTHTWIVQCENCQDTLDGKTTRQNTNTECVRNVLLKADDDAMYLWNWQSYTRTHEYTQKENLQHIMEHFVVLWHVDNQNTCNTQQNLNNI